VSQPYNPYAPPQPQYPPAPFPSPYGAPPPGWGTPAYQIVGPHLVAVSGSPLPDVCLKCGARANLVRKHKKFQWVPQWTYVLLVVSLLVGAIVMTILQKRGTLDVPLCPSCKSRWTHATIAIWLTVLAIFLVLPLGGVLAAVLPQDIGPIVAVVFLLAWLVAVVIVSRVYVRARTVWAKRIENNYITVAGVHPDALAALASALQTNSPA
jgi:hypothetical protein